MLAGASDGDAVCSYSVFRFPWSGSVGEGFFGEVGIEFFSEVFAGPGGFALGDLFGGAGGGDLAAGGTGFRAEVDDPVGALDDVEVVLDDDEGVALINEALEEF